MKKDLPITLALLAVAAVVEGAAPSPTAAEQQARSQGSNATIDFARDIQPILAERCYECHGEKKQKNGFRLDRKTDALRGGDSDKPAIVPGKSAASGLIHRITTGDPDEMMPPKGGRLTAKQVALLRAWIDAGAPWPENSQRSTLNSQPSATPHWAFTPPRRPAIPKVKGKGPVRNEIDAFVLARLESEKIKPSPEADRRTLIRRLGFDLLGLPPTSEEVEAFVNDKSPDAYEHLVDRALASSHFGEHWGRHWLDQARYADSDGYEKDGIRPYAWIYRNWVIDAINRDLPFDQFTIEQLAGDLLPEATEEQRIATGFHRNTLTNKEGGVDQEEFRCKAVVDRVNTTGATWLGLTVGCAECHSHKYDPIAQREYYQLYAFFNAAMEKDIPAPQPIELAQYREAKRAWDQEHTRLKEALAHYLQEDFSERQTKWEQAFSLPEARWTVLEPEKVESHEGATLKTQPDKSILAADKSPATDTYTVVARGEPKSISGFRLEILESSSLGAGVGRAKNGNFVLSEFVAEVLNQDGSYATVAVQNASADYSQPDFPIAASIDADSKSGWAIGPQTSQRHVAVFETKDDLNIPPGARLSFALSQQFGKESTIGRFRLSATTSSRPLKADLTSDSVVSILETAANERNAAQKEELARYYREEVDPGTRKLKNQITEHARKEPPFPETKAQTLAENPKAAKSHIHVRGDFLRKGDEVQPTTPAVLHPLKPRREPADRLDLARWLVDPANPLTSRVAVNQIWRQLFGRALVTTVDDFGTRGEKPSHPELLDWLAVTFMSPRDTQPGVARDEVQARGSHIKSVPLARPLATLTMNRAPSPLPSPPMGERVAEGRVRGTVPGTPTGCGWSRKALIKLIVMSSTYRQSSRVRPELIDRDPNNVLLARQNRFRLEAENIRDAYLAASGLLNPAIGGPSVRPPLPADIAAVGYANSIKWKDSEGPDRYRRGLYIFFQRTVPYPMLMTFDAPDSNVTCTRRDRSDTPLQALTLLNDAVFFECAQALGKRMAADPVRDPLSKLKQAFEMCLARVPTKEELARLQTLYADQLRLVAGHPENAAKIIGDSKTTNPIEAAALVAVARTLMNLDEFLTRE